MVKRISTLLFVVNAFTANAQNNAIFNGGSSDGWEKNAYVQAGNNIFKGGDGDGWHFNAFQQTVANIYAGGNGDGWSYAVYLQAGNSIFNGGDGDGWTYNFFLQAGNSIFFGGAGDGWASVYRPLGVLPVTLLSFTAEKTGTVSLLKWQTAKEEGTAYFDVESSIDAVHFEKKGRVAGAGNSNTPASYSFTDAQPAKGYNYYRLKQVDKNGAFIYTPVRMVLFDAMALQKIRAYPVPATAMLTIELPAQIQNEDAVINVSNALGVMVQQQKLARNRADNKKVLNLATLPAGVYTLQVSSASFSGTQVVIKQ